MLEDTNITVTELKREFEECGDSYIAEHANQIVEAIQLLTKKNLTLKKVSEGKNFVGKILFASEFAKRRYVAYINKYYAKIKDNQIARVVKILDRVCNLSEPKYDDPIKESNRLEKYLQESIYYEDLSKGTSLEKIINDTTERAKDKILTKCRE